MTTTPSSAAWAAAIAKLPPLIQADVDVIRNQGGHLTANQVGAILGKLGAQAEIGTLMMQLLPVAQTYAVVPVSHYQVGAVAAGMPVPGTGWASLYLGANFEFSNAALSFTVHAEQAATNSAWLNGEAGLQALAISAAPCGYCRQFLYELVTAQQLNILLPPVPANPNNPYAYTSTPLTTFLPNAFGPGDLGIKGGLMDPKLCTHAVSLPGGPPADPVIAAALAAAQGCYAPYPTDTAFGYAGIAVQLSDGSVYTGRNAENAAYNPSLSPLESALAFMNMSQPQGASRVVTRCVLVEVPTLSSQKSSSEAVLAAYAPSVKVEYLSATSP
ncbi:cytidine deaminase [Hydrogenophaga sp. RWCD_12]|uniref:cytidine deaminase n=1 Tax=Hydrogenophaga sp. RWCD_12 TaxID=3391190 RepID=UPI003984EB7B